MSGTGSDREFTVAVDETLSAALDDAFPGRDVDDVRPAGPSWNEKNRTVSVHVAGGDTAFLKVANDGDGERIARETAVIDYVDVHCDVPVPAVLASRTGGSTPYLVTAPMPGRNLHRPWSDWNAEERAAAIRLTGAALADVNSRRFERHGHVVGGDADGLALDAGSWTDVLVERIDRMRELATSDRFEHYYDEVRAAVEANRERLDDAPAALVHGDPAMPNVFHRETGVGFVDWEVAHVGDPARELHRARDQLLGSRDLGDDERMVGALHDGYRRRAGSLPTGLEERVPVYDAVRFLGTAGYFDKCVAHAAESEAEFAVRVEAEMERRLAEIR